VSIPYRLVIAALLLAALAFAGWHAALGR